MRVDATSTQCVQFGGILRRSDPLDRSDRVTTSKTSVGQMMRRPSEGVACHCPGGSRIHRFPSLVLSVDVGGQASEAQYFGGFFDGCVYVAAMLYLSLSALGPRRRMPCFDFCPFLRSLYSPPSFINLYDCAKVREGSKVRYSTAPRGAASSTSSREPLSSPLLSFSPCLACPSLVRLLFDRGARRKIRQSATAKENDVTGPAAAVSFWIRRSVVPSLSLSLPPPPK